MTLNSMAIRLAAACLLMFFYFALITPFEFLRAADKSSTLRNALFNIRHGVLFQALDISIGVYFTAWVTLLAHRLPFYGLLDLGIRDRGSLWLALPVSFGVLAIQDFFYYWWHRLEHSSMWLWAIHELHHSEEHVNVTTGIRHHHLEILTKAIFITLPLATLFRLPIVTVGLAAFITQLYNYFIHANTRIGFGPFNRLLASPQSHRIHHSKSPQHIDKNFAASFPLWDVIFGTYYHPRRDEYPETGLTSGRVVRTISEAAFMPFATWKSMLTLPYFSRPSVERDHHV
jgi:sterol desaturase/sphingolipid hydroxylase (fatty acid hydroxylase superfamily)